MKLKILFAVISIFLSISANASQYPELTLTENDRILVMAPHPDDEVIACAGVIQNAAAKKIPVHIVFYTYGDNNEWSFMLYRGHPVLSSKAVQAMGLIRHEEAVSADNVLGIPKENLTFLGYPDFGTLYIWYSHWRNRPAFKSMLTNVRQVPYQNALRPGAPYKGEEILKDITSVIQNFKPTKIFVSHPADHNCDHISLYLFTQVVLWNIENELKPETFPYLVHYARWPMPRGSHPDEPLLPPKLLNGQLSWGTINLNPAQIEQKTDALKKHFTQYKSSAKYLLSFVRENELFGNFPVIDQKTDTGPIPIGPKSTDWIINRPEQLSRREKINYVDVEWDYLKIENNRLMISVKLSKPLGNFVTATIGAFGYRKDKPFADMPKIKIRIGREGFSVFDNGVKLRKKTITILHKQKQITVNIPLDILGNPEKILLSAHTYLEQLPLDNTPWRIIEVE